MKYIKSINPQSSNSAYLEHTKGIFDLHFNHTPKFIPIGEIILLTQRIDNIRYFTHLVTPIDSVIRKTNDDKFNKIIRVKCLACAQKSIPENSTLIKSVEHGAYVSGRIIPLQRMDSFDDETHKKKFVEEIYERFQEFL